VSPLSHVLPCFLVLILSSLYLMIRRVVVLYKIFVGELPTSIPQVAHSKY
jgi:hypothetical protein